MKIIEVTKHLNVAITNEEAEVLDRFDEDTPVVAKGDFTDRQQLMANQLVNKDILLRKNENGRIIYKKRTG
jgi:cytochrome c-type biogenesis protein CcmE